MKSSHRPQPDPVGSYLVYRASCLQKRLLRTPVPSTPRPRPWHAAVEPLPQLLEALRTAENDCKEAEHAAKRSTGLADPQYFFARPMRTEKSSRNH